MKRPKLGVHAIRSLGRALTRWSAATGEGVDPVLRERVILHISAINACEVCTAFHVRSARRIGLEDEDIGAACALDLTERDARTRTAMRYGELRTLDLERDHPDEVEAFEATFSPDEQEALRATIDLFTFNNRFNNTWEGLPGAARLKRRLGVP